MADNAQIARRLFDLWNERKFDEVADSIAPDGQITIVGSGETYRGPEGALQYNKMWADGFPDGSVTVDRVVSADDMVVVEYTGRGTHTGTLATPMGSIAPTGRSITLHLCDVVEFSAEKVKSQRTYFDTGSLMAQLGITAGQTATTP
ncbi:MAG: ester cyclase [Actinomycetes bacterium]